MGKYCLVILWFYVGLNVVMCVVVVVGGERMVSLFVVSVVCVVVMFGIGLFS